jgi:hypothetical protein
MAALSLVAQRDITRAFAPVPPRERGPSLRDQVVDLEILVDTILALDPEDLEPELRAELEIDLAGSIAGTKLKVDATSAAFGVLEASMAAAQKEAKRLLDRVEFYERGIERLTDYVLAVLDASKLKQLDGFTSTLTGRANPPKVFIAEGTVLPPEFMRTPPAPPAPSPQPDKKMIGDAIKAGVLVAGCELRQSKRLVRS